MKFFKSLRFRLILLVLLAVLPALGIMIFSGLEQRRLARQSAEESAYRLTRQVAGYQSSLIEGSRQLLLSLSLAPQVLDPATCNAYLQSLARIYPMYSSFGAALPNGDLVCSSLTLPNPPVNLTQRTYFQEALEQKQFVVGDVVTGLISNQQILPMALPVYDDQSRLSMVLVGSLDLNYILQYAASLNLPPQSAMLMVGGDGTILLRYPQSEQWVGRSLPQVPIIQEILAATGEGSAEAAGVDNVKRLYAFTPLQVGDPVDQKLFISVGIPSEIAYQEADQILVRSLSWLAVSILVALIAAWFGGEVFFLRVVSLTAERDAAEDKLRAANAELEDRVAQRTAELSLANERLNNELEERQRTVMLLHQREGELKRLLEALERSNRDLQDFAYITSHDLQEPLRKIQAFGDRLVQRYGPQLGEEGMDFAKRMNNSASRLQFMINDLLSYSRVKTHGDAFKPVRLSEAVEDAVNNLEMRIRDTGAQVLVGDLPTIQADRTQMEKLLQNLIGNALKFHRPDVPPVVKVNGTVTRESDAARDMATIIIEDNGIGFDEKYLDRIFQPFQRLHGRDQYEGSGIGLAICRRIVERHGGCITASSRPGEGSRFMITLPVSQPQGAPADKKV